MITLGLDIGSNSVGSAWVNLDSREIHLAASVFPAGVDEQEDKRGAPKNQARRDARSQRRNIARRALRKRQLIRFLMERGLLPKDPGELQKAFDKNPWTLRRKAIKKDGEPLTSWDFGRILVHLGQRRGAVGVVIDPEEPEEGKVKEGMERLETLMKGTGASTVGEFMAGCFEQRVREHKGIKWNEPIRNRQYRMPEDQMLFAGRNLIQEEFHKIIAVQRSKESELAAMLTDDLVRQLDDATQTDAWRHRGLLFGQRRTYWDTGTLGRCDLEPTERCVPIADRHASYFRVLETVNNIQMEERGHPKRPLTRDEREKIIELLRGPLGVYKKGKYAGQPKASVSVTDIKRTLPKGVRLNIEADEDREINTDWFHREIVHGAFGTAKWEALTERAREAVNRAILRFDPDQADDAARLLEGSKSWWGLDATSAGKLIDAWKRRPKLEKRLNLSRRAILNFLPYMERFDEASNRWPTQQEARKAYAKTLPQGHARRRYETGAAGLTAADRRYMRLGKHQISRGIPELPPAPMLSNPVVRKAIYEVRRHLLAYLRKFGRKPDRVVIEMARITKQSEKQRNLALARNRNRDKEKKAIINEILPVAFGAQIAQRLSLNQQRAAVDRVVLARQQNFRCPYCGQDGLGDPVAARGDGLEIDHIVPYSRCGDNGLNNRVLVHKTCNQGKGNRTPREWWGTDFANRVRFAEESFKGREPAKGEYFTKRDFARKWENFNRELHEADEWKNSQLTDTAYAARQVAGYLADALFDGRGLPERGDGEAKQAIFFTTGRITSMLRKDWQLFETLKGDELSAAEEVQLAEKNRGDHRQHALDAATIALTDPRIKNSLANWATQAAEYKEKHGRWPRRTPVPPPQPWNDVRSFRRTVLSKVYGQFDDADGNSRRPNNNLVIISHRPVKRRLIGAFHEQDAYGPVIGQMPSHRPEPRAKVFSLRMPIFMHREKRLKPGHLRVSGAWDQVSAQLEKEGLSRIEKRAICRKLSAIVDPPAGKGGIVRDRTVRDRIRKCLLRESIDPDRFTVAEIQRIAKDGKLTMASGVPIKSVVLLRSNSDPVIIPRKKLDLESGKMVPDMDPTNLSEPNPRTKRVYIGGNNHHVEIVSDNKGRWSSRGGQVVSGFDAARRLCARLKALREAGVPPSKKLRRLPKKDRECFKPIVADVCRRFPIIDQSSGVEGQFVMSLAEGEMIYARRWDPSKKQAVGPADYFVVCKLDKARIHFAPHWDARKSGGTKGDDGKVIEGSEQDRWDVTPADLKHCGPEPTKPPIKVRVSPLGEVTPLSND
ncbi:MAG: type II CRISPR RNA-guided endonuclease Cas9 [Tepidisphaeraceae bacterium]